MDISQLTKRLGLLKISAKTVSKAQEYLRLLAVRTGGASWGQQEACKSACCLEIACKVLSEDVEFDRAAAAKACCASAKVYEQTLTAVQNVLQISVAPGIKELCVTFGCLGLQSFAEQQLRQFRQRYLAALPEIRRAHVDVGGAVYVAVAFYLAARKKKTAVDRKRLRSLMGYSEREFAQVSAAFAEHLPTLITAKKPRKPSASKSGDASGGDEADPDGALDPNDIDLKAAESNPAARDSSAVKYAEWKERMLAADEADRNGAKKQKARKPRAAAAGRAGAAGHGDADADGGDGDAANHGDEEAEGKLDLRRLGLGGTAGETARSTGGRGGSGQGAAAAASPARPGRKRKRADDDDDDDGGSGGGDDDDDGARGSSFATAKPVAALRQSTLGFAPVSRSSSSSSTGASGAAASGKAGTKPGRIALSSARTLTFGRSGSSDDEDSPTVAAAPPAAPRAGASRGAGAAAAVAVASGSEDGNDSDDDDDVDDRPLKLGRLGAAPAAAAARSKPASPSKATAPKRGSPAKPRASSVAAAASSAAASSPPSLRKAGASGCNGSGARDAARASPRKKRRIDYAEDDRDDSG